MRLSRSSKKLINTARKYSWPVVGLATVSAFLLGAGRQAYSPIRKIAPRSGNNSASQSSKNSAKTGVKSAATSTVATVKSASAPPPQVAGVQTPNFSHSNIVTTYFWVGEPGDSDNDGISNTKSTWDSQWQSNFGGVDTPNARNGYLPAGFTPKENTFYFALPYSDIDDNGNRKASATGCPNYPALKDQSYSWCKNSWIAIRSNGKIAYAQWEDAGPYGEDDTAYVFGTAAPKNQLDVKAGLDVSPAVHDYLGLGDVSNCDWGFVSAADVPSGPWTQTITTHTGDNTVN